MKQKIRDSSFRKRNCKGYDEWQRKTKELYNYTCFLCGNKKEVLHSHHILPYYKYPEYRTDIKNACVFCKTCHEKFHILYGYLDSTLEQLVEFFRRHKAPESKIEFLQGLLEGKVIIKRRKLVRRINTTKIVKIF